MYTKKFANIGGWVMLIIGVLALIPAFSETSYLLPALKIETSYGLFLGLFPMNILNKLALIGFGVFGIMCSRADDVITSVKYSRVLCITMAVLAVLGLFPATNTLFSYWPLFRGEVVLHAVLAVLGGYYGYIVPTRVYNSKAHP